MNNLNEQFYEIKKITTDKVLNGYIEELEKDIRITKTNIKEKSMMVSSLRSKWLNYYFFEKEENLSKLVILKEIYSKKKISSKNISDPLIKIKAEVALENGDAKLIKVNEMIKQVKERLDFLERAQNILAELSHCIHNSIELFKIEGGM